MTARAKLETALENKCIEYAATQGFLPLKADKIKKGWPDHIFFGPNRIVLIAEFKRPGYKPKPKQKSIHRQLARRGFPVHIVTLYADFVSLVASYR